MNLLKLSKTKCIPQIAPQFAAAHCKKTFVRCQKVSSFSLVKTSKWSSENINFRNIIPLKTSDDEEETNSLEGTSKFDHRGGQHLDTMDGTDKLLKPGIVQRPSYIEMDT
jgi:hypothetical protein